MCYEHSPGLVLTQEYLTGFNFDPESGVLQKGQETSATGPRMMYTGKTGWLSW